METYQIAVIPGDGIGAEVIFGWACRSASRSRADGKLYYRNRPSIRGHASGTSLTVG